MHGYNASDVKSKEGKSSHLVCSKRYYVRFCKLLQMSQPICSRDDSVPYFRHGNKLWNKPCFRVISSGRSVRETMRESVRICECHIQYTQSCDACPDIHEFIINAWCHRCTPYWHNVRVRHSWLLCPTPMLTVPLEQTDNIRCFSVPIHIKIVHKLIKNEQRLHVTFTGDQRSSRIQLTEMLRYPSIVVPLQSRITLWSQK